MAYADGQIFITSVTAANRRDVPRFENTTGTVITGGAAGDLSWAADGNRKTRARIDGSYFAYNQLEVLTGTSIRVYETTLQGDTTTRDVTGLSPGGTYTTLIHGVSITLHSSLTAGHIAKVYIGIFPLDANTFYNIRGEDGDSVKLYYYNPGTITHALSSIKAGRAGWFDNSSGTPITNFNLIGDASGNYIAPADVYALTVANGSLSGKLITLTGALGTFTADNVANSATGVTFSGSIGFTLDVGTLSNTNTASITISDYADALELAPDSAGSPGTWVAWSDATGINLPISSAGESDQLVAAAESVAFWVRCSPDITHPIGRGVAFLMAKSYQRES